MSEERTDPTIYLPQPKGHRRGAIMFRSTPLQAFDCEPEELAKQIRGFLTGDQQLLELRDAHYGEPYLLSRTAVEREMIGLVTAWVENPAPRTKRSLLVPADSGRPIS